MNTVTIRRKESPVPRKRFSKQDIELIPTTRSETLKEYLFTINSEMIDMDLIGNKFPERLLQIRETLKNELSKRGTI